MYKNAKVIVTNNVDHIATAAVCNLLFLGILAGTKSILAWILGSGRNGVVVSECNLSRREEAESVLVAEENALRVSAMLMSTAARLMR